MGQSRFLLSPLIEDTAEFGLLFNQDHFLDKKTIASFSIQPQHLKKNHLAAKLSNTFYELSRSRILSTISVIIYLGSRRFIEEMDFAE